MANLARIEYERWFRNANEHTRDEMRGMSATEIEDSFYQDLSFGTGGLRGIIGVGPNRMNEYTVAKATQGLANYLNGLYSSPSVAIARDSRHKGEEFAKIAASVLAANGVHVKLYPRIEPTPALSFAVRHLGCSAGICITASHNPANYSGYKVYGDDGCQITTAAAQAIQSAIDGIDIFEDILLEPFETGIINGKIAWIQDDVLDCYIDAVIAQSTNDSCNTVSVVYTPLHGAGLECALKVFNRINVSNLTIEPKQAIADGDFPTCPCPNPELPEAMEVGLALCDVVKPDLLLASDPDADRTGIAAAHHEEYFLLSGNEIGVLLADYLCSKMEESGQDVQDAIVITTIVSSEMITSLAIDRGFELRRTLTGFKFIGEQIGILEESGSANRFLFGFEESYGYLCGDYVRDKDSIVTCMLICEMTQWHKSHGMSLIDALHALYARYGFFKNKLISIHYPGARGARQMQSMMNALRINPPDGFCDAKVIKTIDYLQETPMSIIGGHEREKQQILPTSNVIEFVLSNQCKLIIRPSGTEPKIKAYLFSHADCEHKATALIEELETASLEFFESWQ